MKHFFLFLIPLTCSILITYFVGLDEYSKRPNFKFGDSRREFYNNMKIKLLNTAAKQKMTFSDVTVFSDSIMISNGFIKYNSWYYQNGKKKYFDEILNYSK